MPPVPAMPVRSDDDLRAYPKTPFLAVSASVFRDGQVLIARRSRPPLEGLWSLPGGGVEIGEALKDAAAREVFEETGIEADILAPADVIEMIRHDGRGDIERHYVIVSFAALWRAGDAQARDGTDAVCWVAPDRLSGFDLTEGTAAVVLKAAALVAGRE